MAFRIDPGLLGLLDSVALVTGAGAGIGRGCALQLARAGCHLAVVELDAEAAARTVAEIEELGRRAVPVEADACDPADVETMFERAQSALGPLEVSCHVVGNPAHPPKPLLDTSLHEWNANLVRNLDSAFLATKAAARAMIEHRVAGRIVNVASSSGVVGAPNVAGYGAAKAGVIHLTRSAAMELGRYGIRVNCIVPGTHTRPPDPSAPPPTPAMERFRRLAAQAPPLGRLGDPMETGGVAVFLASDLSAYVTGHAVFSDGGVVHTTARPPVGMAMLPEAIAHLGWVRDLHEAEGAGGG